eukprot:gene5904-9734_t
MSPNCIFTVSYDQNSNRFSFIDPNRNFLTAESGNTRFYVSQISNGYKLQSESGKYLGLSADGRLLIYNDDSSINTRWNVTSYDNTDVGKTFKHGDIIALKRCNQMYFGYNSKSSPISTNSITDENHFIVEKHGIEYKFKSKKYNFYAVCAKSTDTNFILSKETSGFSLFSNGKVLVFENSLAWETRFYPVKIKPKNLLLKKGSKIVFRTTRGYYFYYDNSGKPTAGVYCKNAIFNVEQYENKFKFKDSNGFYMLTTKGNQLFTITEFIGSSLISLFSRSHYLGVGKDEMICVYDSNSGENRKFYLESPKKDISIFEHGNQVKFKTNTETFFYYTDKGSPISSIDCDLSVFTIEKIGDYFQFKNRNKVYMLTTQGNNKFIVNKTPEGYHTLFSGKHFLGVSSDNRVLVFNSDDGKNTRFYPILVKSQPNYIKDGNSISFRTNNGTYFYYNDSRSPVSGAYHKNAVFKVGSWKFFKFKNPNGTYMLTTVGNNLFTVEKCDDYYTLFSGQHFLGISSDGKVLLYQSNNGKETRFYALSM